MSGEAPWLGGGIVLRREVLEAVDAHALECYPSEACGLLTGPEGEPLVVDACQREANEADRYHALDPERFPRTSRTYFKMNELRAARAFEEGAAAGRPVKVIYHSHCDTGAHFSAEDAATFCADGTLTWPCAFLVVSVRADAIADRRLWVHVTGTDRFRDGGFEVR